ncbi:hypothetical protein QJS04_geneDACA023810 [Acorus gramineus]|uniref:Spindle and kinetochore-associated protein 3 n=1 Tax=Acorus gramineus TaxID=55184 RepID=A0AAV8ZZY1_ACOGR|nr:hypothetical protein QJS04_geneDACA023810 [Acorus gramineus]
MAFGTVSFEELLGHCNEVYKKNQSDLSEVEQRLEELGFEILMDGGNEVLDVEDEVDLALTYRGSASPASVIKKRIEEDPLFAESISLKDLGLSDACLATLASEDSDELLGDDLLVSESLCDSLVDISRDDYDGLPPNLKSLASWEDLQATVTKLREQSITFRSKGFSRDEFEAFGLGIKGKTCLLLLLRMNRLVMETVGGLIIYRISHCT